MENKTSIEIVGMVVELLNPLEPTDRLRVINAALSLLGNQPLSVGAPADSVNDGADISHLPPRARAWIKQHDIAPGQLNQVFHITDGNAEVIVAEIPGKSTKEKTYNAYVLTGIARLISSGAPVFDDKSARLFCKSSGCLNEANHSSYLANKGNIFTGSKDKGWTLTAPGLQQGAVLVKELAK